MQFNPGTTSGEIQSIVDYADFRAGTTATSYPLYQKTMSANVALSRVHSLILEADDRIKFDDFNFTDMPVLTFNLQAGVRKYQIYKDDNDKRILTFQQVLIKDPNGKWKTLTLTAANKASDSVDINTDDGTTGTPDKYDVVGTWLRFNALPSYSFDGGIKLVFQREMSYFSTTDTSKEPGFDPRYHVLIPLYMAYDYAASRDLKKATNLFNEIQTIEAQLKAAYTSKSEEENVTLTTRQESYD